MKYETGILTNVHCPVCGERISNIRCDLVTDPGDYMNPPTTDVENWNLDDAEYGCECYENIKEHCSSHTMITRDGITVITRRVMRPLLTAYLNDIEGQCEDSDYDLLEED